MLIFTQRAITYNLHLLRQALLFGHKVFMRYQLYWWGLSSGNGFSRKSIRNSFDCLCMDCSCLRVVIYCGNNYKLDDRCNRASGKLEFYVLVKGMGIICL